MTRWILLGPEGVDVPGASGGPDLPGSVGGRGATWDLTSDQAPVVPEGFDAVELTPVSSRCVPLPGRRVKRTLLLSVRPDAPPSDVAAFEAALLGMPRHIGTIRSWALGRVANSAAVDGSWTHAWEQEYEDVEGLTGEYLLNAYHWTYVDRFFDAELPGAIVAPRLAHVFRWAEAAVL